VDYLREKHLAEHPGSERLIIDVYFRDVRLKHIIPSTVEATKRVLQLGIRYFYCEVVFEYKF
jgi:hypothetical protein